MNISKIAIALLCAGTLAFVGCGKKDEKKGDEAAKPAAGEQAPAAEGDKAPAAEGDKAPAAAEGDKAPAAEGGAIGDAEMEKAWTLMQSMAAAAKDNKEDCKAMAGAFNKVFDENAELMKKMNSMKDDEASQKKWDEKYKAESEKLMMGMMSDMGKCMQDPDMQAAMKRMN